MKGTITYIDLFMEELDVFDCFEENRCSIGLEGENKISFSRIRKEFATVVLCESKGESRKKTFPKGETSCWSAVILSPNFSFLTCKQIKKFSSMRPIITKALFCY